MEKINIVAITISTKYDDILNINIHQNYKYFEKWYIITSITDEKTINVIKKANYPNIEILYYNFYEKNAIFNKGGALKYAQSLVYEKHNNVNILLLDSDIYLPNNFETYMSKIKLLPYCVYGPHYRYDFSSYDDFLENKNSKLYHKNAKCYGYFQMYYYNKEIPMINKFLYKDSMNCSICDILFLNYFKNRIIIQNMEVYHLGEPKINWNTRKSYDDFYIDNKYTQDDFLKKNIYIK